MSERPSLKKEKIFEEKLLPSLNHSICESRNRQNDTLRKIRLTSNNLFAFQDDHINNLCSESEDHNNDTYYIPNNNTLNSSNFFSICDKSNWIKLDPDARTNYEDQSICSITDDMERQLDFLNEVDDLNDAKLSLDDTSIISDNKRETVESEDLKCLNTQQSFSSIYSNGSSINFNMHAKSVDFTNRSPLKLGQSVHNNKMGYYPYFENDVLRGSYQYSFCTNFPKLQMKPDDKAILDNLFMLMKDQNGCRMLQRKFEEKSLDFFLKFYEKIKDNLKEIFCDQFGNYVIQKFVECCPDKTLISNILEKIKQNLLTLSINPYGTRAFQKLLDYINNIKDYSIIKDFITTNMLSLLKDNNGHHVVQKIILVYPIENNSFLYIEIIKYIVELSKLKQGSCIFQKLIDQGSKQDKNKLILKVINNISELINDEFGNFIIQHIINLKIDEYNQMITKYIIKDLLFLAKQKFSSNVIDKAIFHEESIFQTSIIDKIIEKKMIGELIMDKYGNYVVQKALQVTSGNKFMMIIEMISKVLKNLKQTTFGRKIYENLIANYGEYFKK